MQNAIVLKYGYSHLPQKDEIKNHTLAIKSSMRRTVEEIISIGEHLTAVKELLPHGEFGKWLKAEFGMSQMTATRYMNVYNRFGKFNTVLNLESNKSEAMLSIPSTPKVAYELAAPSFPEETREKLKKGYSVEVDGEPKTIDQLTVADVKKLKPQKTEQPYSVQVESVDDEKPGTLDNFKLLSSPVESEPSEVSSLKKQLRQLQAENALLLEKLQKKEEKLQSTMNEKTDVPLSSTIPLNTVNDVIYNAVDALFTLRGVLEDIGGVSVVSQDAIKDLRNAFNETERLLHKEKK